MANTWKNYSYEIGLDGILRLWLKGEKYQTQIVPDENNYEMVVYTLAQILNVSVNDIKKASEGFELLDFASIVHEVEDAKSYEEMLLQQEPEPEFAEENALLDDVAEMQEQA